MESLECLAYGQSLLILVLGGLGLFLLVCIPVSLSRFIVVLLVQIYHLRWFAHILD